MNLQMIKKDLKCELKVTSVPLLNLATMEILEIKTQNLLGPNNPLSLEVMTHIKLNSWLTYGLYGRQAMQGKWMLQTGLLAKIPSINAETMMISNLNMLRYNRFVLGTIGFKHQHAFLSDNRLTLAVEAVYARTHRQ